MKKVGIDPCGYVWKSIPGRGNNQCKGPVAGTCLACQRDSSEMNKL